MYIKHVKILLCHLLKSGRQLLTLILILILLLKSHIKRA